MAKDILEQGHKGLGWTKMKNNVKYKTLYSEYAGIKQRWIIVHSHRAFYKEQLTFKNRLDERSEQLYLLHKKFRSRLYKSEDEARDEASQLKRRFPYHKIKSKIVPVYNGFLDVGKNELAHQGYRIEIEYIKDFLKIDRTINRKGKYIIATNISETEKADNQIYAAYQRRNANIESCFRQVKSFQFIGKGIYFKNIRRIQALMSVVALTLFVNNVGQLILRKGLNSTKQKVFNFAGKKIKNPTFAMIGKLMRRVSMITIKHKGGTYSRVLDLSDDLRKVVNLFGPQAQMAYGFT